MVEDGELWRPCGVVGMGSFGRHRGLWVRGFGIAPIIWENQKYFFPTAAVVKLCFKKMLTFVFIIWSLGVLDTLHSGKQPKLALPISHHHLPISPAPHWENWHISVSIAFHVRKTGTARGTSLWSWPGAYSCHLCNGKTLISPGLVPFWPSHWVLSLVCCRPTGPGSSSVTFGRGGGRVRWKLVFSAPGFPYGYFPHYQARTSCPEALWGS